MTLKMTSAQVVETSVNINNNSSLQNYTNPDDHTQQTNVYIGMFQLVLNECRVHQVLPLFFNLSPLYTLVSKNVVSVSDISAVNLIVG